METQVALPFSPQPGICPCPVPDKPPPHRIKMELILSLAQLFIVNWWANVFTLH